MTSPLSAGDSSRETLALSASTPRRAWPLALLLALGAIVLIGSEIWLMAGLAFWSLSGLFGNSTSAEVVLAILILPPALWASWKIIVLGIEAERYPDQTAD